MQAQTAPNSRDLFMFEILLLLEPDLRNLKIIYQPESYLLILCRKSVYQHQS